MKRILGMAVVLSLMGALNFIAGCSNGNSGKPGKVDVIDLGGGMKLEMALVTAGKFKMGFTKEELSELKVEIQDDFEKFIKQKLEKEQIDVVDLFMSRQGKQHEVTLTKPFYMGKYEVTQGQYEAVMGINPSSPAGAKLPVTNVSWENCQEFIKKLNFITKGNYRLPTEAEWEFACRAGSTTRYSFGDKITPKDANYTSSNIGKTVPVAVGSYKPNAFGLYDMHGNVEEWCEDWLGEYPFAVTDPMGPATGKERVLRGGSFGSDRSSLRSSYRSGEWPDSTGGGLNGFRLAKDK
jgi:formylglycine-generating enzyme required for sulfatase activity